MTITQDHYIVAIDQMFHSEVTKSGIITHNEAYSELDDMKSNQHRRIFGTVLACPATFSDKIINLVDEGVPAYNLFISSDYIEAKANEGYTVLPEYYPSTRDRFEFTTINDFSKKVNVKTGEKIYFDFNVLQEENILGDHKGKPMYKVRVDQIYCVIRREREDVTWISWKDRIVMQGGWVLAEADEETWDDITTPAGIIKKPKPDAKALRAFVRHLEGRTDIKVNDLVVFLPMADAPLKVEGKDYLCMHEDWIVSKIRPK